MNTEENELRDISTVFFFCSYIHEYSQNAKQNDNKISSNENSQRGQKIIKV